MARIIYGALAQDVRGSLAGTTFTKCRSGATIRQKVTPTNRQTPNQLGARANFSRCAQIWRTLTDDQRAQWANFATQHPITDAFGKQIILSGAQQFTSTNAKRLALGGPVTLTP